jgi:membrane-bound lytic murein transglycosylase D
MKKLIWCIFLFLPLMAIANNKSDTTTIVTDENDSITDLINNPNLDKMMDSIVSARPLEVKGNDNSLFFVEIDTSAKVFTNHPDSFYINRLNKIPSVVELTYNGIVKRFIEVYTMKRRDKVEEMLTLKEYYFPMFEEVFDKYDLPLELKYLSIIESALNPNAVSRAGATGLWQFMYGTGRLYKLNINSFVDERRDPLAETYAAAKFLKDLYSIYNDWGLVIAAYNCGPGNVNKAIRRSGGKRNYWDIYYFLPRETRGYVPAFIAAMYVMNYHKDHNLFARSSVIVPPPADTIMVNKNIHLQQVADVLNLPLQQLRDLNPQYRHDIIPGKYSACALRLPEKDALRFIDHQDSIIKYKNALYFTGDLKITSFSSSSSRSGRYLPPPPTGNMDKVYHKVATGENLGQIGTQYHVRVSDIRYWNDISRNKIRAGQNLVIYVPKKKASGQIIAQQATAKATAKPTTVKQGNSEEFILYEVKSGDSLYKIASQYPGVSSEDLMKWNNLAYGSKIQPGQTIKIKKIN